ncbi:MAG: EFR1 family ferrodoxin, partial [Fibrobacterota bacterium]
GFSTYPIVFNFLQKIEKVHGNCAFAFDTMGGTSLWGIMGKLKTILANKGFRTLGFEEFKMPPNLFVKFPENWRRTRVEKGLRRAEDFVNKLISGDLSWNRIPIVSEVMYRLSHALFSITEYKWHQKYLKMKVDTTKCNSCGICSSKCPVKNIIVKEKAEIGNHCLYCFRCAGVCPSKAISGIASPRSLHYLAEGAQF